METATAKAKFIRISPFKVRRIANEIVGKDVLSAESYLSVLPNKGAGYLKKVVHSARTNFINKNPNTDEENLIIKKILVDSGPTLKRYHPIARGRAQSILKRSSHIYVEIMAREGVK